MRAEAERLLREGRMPPLEEVLRVIEELRQKYRQRIAEVGSGCVDAAVRT